MKTVVLYSKQLDAYTYEIQPDDRRRKPYRVTISARGHSKTAGGWREALDRVGWPRAAVAAFQRAFVRVRREIEREAA